MKGRYWLLLLLVLGYFSTGIAQIRPEERAIVQRWGRIVAKPGPGLWIGLPYGIDQVHRISIASVRRLTVGFEPTSDLLGQPTPAGQLLTGDRNLVDVQVTLDYRVAETDQALEDYFLHRDRVEAVLARQTESLLAEWTAGHRVDEVLLTGNAALPTWLIERLQQRLEPYRLGVRVQQANVSYLQPPEPVLNAFQEVNRAQTTMRTQESNARQEAKQRERQALSEKYRLEQLTSAYVESVKDQALAEAQAFRERAEQFQRLRQNNPQLLSAIWWEETEKIIATLREKRATFIPLDRELSQEGISLSVPPAPKKR